MLERNPSWSRPELRQDRNAAAVDDGGISRAELLGYARRHLVGVAGCMILGLLSSALYVASHEPTFTAQTQILIDPKTPPLLDTQGGELETSLDTAEVESQMTLLRSEMIANMVIDALDLTRDPEFQGEKPSRFELLVNNAADLASSLGVFEPASVEAWREDFLERRAEATAGTVADPASPAAASPDDEAARRRITLAIFQSKLGVSRVSVAYVIEIAFSSRDPDKAAQIANATADAYLQEQLLSKIAAMEQGNEWLESRLNELRRKLNAATQAAQAFRARHDYSIPETSPGEIASVVAGEIPAEDAGVATLEELEATADTYRRLYGTVLETFTSSMQHKSYPYSLVRVITPAAPPFAKSHPRSKISLVFGGLAGLLVGVGLAFTRNSLDFSIRSARQVRADVGADCLVEVPRIRSWGNPRRALAYAARHPQSAFVEALQRLKTAIRVNAKPDGTVAIGVTSALRGEGKSVIASNLGLVCVAAGYRTLVCDGDPLRSTLTRSFPRSPEPADAQAAGASPSAADQPAAEAPERRLGWFDLMPSPFVGGPSEWARTPAQPGAWKDVRSGYDVIIVDLPPMEVAIDVLPALPPLDFVIVLAESGSTPVDTVSDAARIADAVGPPLLGVALTKGARAGLRRRRTPGRRAAPPIR